MNIPMKIMELIELNDIIEIKVLNARPHDYGDEKVIRGEFLEMEEAFIKNYTRMKNARHSELVSDLKSGRKDITVLRHAALKFDASRDGTYTRTPPIDGPSDKKQYFLWSGKLVRKLTKESGNYYIVWEAGVNPFYEELAPLGAELILTEGFAFKDIRKSFGEVMMNRIVKVVGRYSENIDIQLISGEIKTIPVLSGCYIE